MEKLKNKINSKIDELTINEMNSGKSLSLARESVIAKLDKLIAETNPQSQSNIPPLKVSDILSVDWVSSTLREDLLLAYEIDMNYWNCNLKYKFSSSSKHAWHNPLIFILNDKHIWKVNNGWRISRIEKDNDNKNNTFKTLAEAINFGVNLINYWS
tara:strand:+ start:436 stop:903 length:468 start_codon:yes stop_codon:yes gene_type:complete